MARPARAVTAKGLVTKVALPSAAVGEYHAHGCIICSRRYTDTLKACGNAKENGLCTTCRNGTERSVWDRDVDPRSCCRTSSRLVTDGSEITKYSLGGPGPWFRCRTCSRTHPFDPTRSTS